MNLLHFLKSPFQTTWFVIDFTLLAERLSTRQCEIFISDRERLDMRVNDY